MKAQMKPLHVISEFDDFKITLIQKRFQGVFLRLIQKTRWNNSAKNKYCAPVWINSAHIKIVDTQLNIEMRTISGYIRTTLSYWLPHSATYFHLA